MQVETVGENGDIVLDDNYEEISMDLDSLPNSPKCKLYTAFTWTLQSTLK